MLFGNAGAWICGDLTTFWALLATVALVWPGFGTGWFRTSRSADGALVRLGFAHERLQFAMHQIVPLVALVIVGILFYLAVQATRAHEVEVSCGDTEALSCDLVDTPGGAPRSPAERLLSVLLRLWRWRRVT